MLPTFASGCPMESMNLNSASMDERRPGRHRRTGRVKPPTSWPRFSPPYACFPGVSRRPERPAAGGRPGGNRCPGHANEPAAGSGTGRGERGEPSRDPTGPATAWLGRSAHPRTRDCSCRTVTISPRDLRVSIRGFGARSNFGIRGIKILVDGIPETLPDGQGQVDSIDLGAARQIEVLRGTQFLALRQCIGRRRQRDIGKGFGSADRQRAADRRRVRRAETPGQDRRSDRPGQLLRQSVRLPDRRLSRPQRNREHSAQRPLRVRPRR